MNIFKRIRNLWRLSNYRIDPRTKDGNTQFLVKEISTIKHKPATIIKEDQPDIFEQKDDTTY